MAIDITHSNNTIKTRIQLKSDTEANWKKVGPKDGSNGFIPLLGEIIIYTPDETHSFSRLKVGDGITDVINLPFIDAGTIDGLDVEIVKASTSNDFPSPGSPDKLYIDLSTNKIYHYTVTNGYIQLCPPTKTNIRKIVYWGAGWPTSIAIENHTLKITNGATPQLETESLSVVTDV